MLLLCFLPGLIESFTFDAHSNQLHGNRSQSLDLQVQDFRPPSVANAVSERFEVDCCLIHLVPDLVDLKLAQLKSNTVEH